MDPLAGIVQDFAAAWRGATPRIENFLPADPVERRRLLFQLIPIDVQERWKQGHPCRIEDYLERFPDLKQDQQALSVLLELGRLGSGASAGNASSFSIHGGEESTLHGPKTHASESLPEEPTLPDPPRDFFAQLDALPLLDAAGRKELPHLRERFVTPQALIDQLVERGRLTRYQGTMLLEGRGLDLALGSYLLLEPLGQGGMGLVFKARNLLDGQVVALKHVAGKSLKDRRTVRRFQREIRVLSRLSHPNIVRALEAGRAGDTHFLAMEYVEGVDLHRLLTSSGRLPITQACAYLAQAARGLEHAHSHGLVHRDIKPSNLILQTAPLAAGQTGRGEAGAILKILDLGLARWTGDSEPPDSTTLTLEDALIGTPDYMAPEQIMDPRDVDIRTDLYSLGCTLYHLLTGQAPFPGGSVTEKLVKHQTCAPVSVRDLRPEVPRSLDELVRTLMAKKPAERYQTPGEVENVLVLHARFA
jgi:tRNA A-37 threonylcarbamoyl transferase component Bud32